MADITLTAVVPDKTLDPNPVIVSGDAGATIAAGQVVYFDAATVSYKLAHAVTSSATAAARGIALNSAIAGQPIEVMQKGVLTCSGLTAGRTYALSGTTAGAIAPDADMEAASTWRNSQIGVALSATKLKVAINNSDTVNA